MKRALIGWILAAGVAPLPAPASVVAAPLCEDYVGKYCLVEFQLSTIAGVSVQPTRAEFAMGLVYPDAFADGEIVLEWHSNDRDFIPVAEFRCTVTQVGTVRIHPSGAPDCEQDLRLYYFEPGLQTLLVTSDPDAPGNYPNLPPPQGAYLCAGTCGVRGELTFTA